MRTRQQLLWALFVVGLLHGRRSGNLGYDVSASRRQVHKYIIASDMKDLQLSGPGDSLELALGVVGLMFSTFNVTSSPLSGLGLRPFSGLWLPAGSLVRMAC